MASEKAKYVWLIICTMATFFTFATDQGSFAVTQTNQGLNLSRSGFNYILIGLMSIIPFLLFIKYPYLRKNEFIIYSLFVFMLIVSIRHNETFRLSTILYSILFITTFIYYWRLIKEVPLTISTYQKIITFLLWAFFIIMLIQQFSAAIGIPIFNYRVGEQSSFKVNSLASEPSYFGKIVTVLMISFISIKEIENNRRYNLTKDFRKDGIIWTIYFYQMLLCGSSFALLLLLFFLLRFIRLRLKTIALFFFVLSMITIIVTSIDLSPVQRLTKIGQAILSFDENNIFNADQSGAFRVVPSILYLKQINLVSPDFWFGAGIDYTRSTMPTIMPALNENGFNVGLFPAFIWDFGFIATILLIWFVLKFAITKKYPIDFLIWFIIVLDAPFNTQLFWITLILMSTNKFLQRNNNTDVQLATETNVDLL